MKQTFDTKDINWQAVDIFLDTLVRMESAQEFCKSVVHTGFSDGIIHGCQLYSLDGQSNLSIVAGYGLGFDHLPAVFSTWDSNPIAAAVSSKQWVFVEGSADHRPMLAIPAVRDSYPMGALALVLSPEVSSMPMDESLVPVIGKLATWWLGNMNTSNSRYMGAGSGNGENLTQRQIQILDRMAQGMINSEIAQELLVSESTVRQETVRIYRELGVPNRAEAAKKGRALGLVKRPTPPPRIIDEFRGSKSKFAT